MGLPSVAQKEEAPMQDLFVGTWAAPSRRLPRPSQSIVHRGRAGCGCRPLVFAGDDLRTVCQRPEDRGGARHSETRPGCCRACGLECRRRQPLRRTWWCIHRSTVSSIWTTSWERFRTAQIGAESGAERRLEFVGVRGDSVVVMGEEVYTPGKNAPNAGKLVHRRFTDIWKQYGGRWKLAIRQATVTSVQ